MRNRQRGSLVHSLSHAYLLKLTVLGVGKPKDGLRRTEQGERQSEEAGGGEREPRAHLSSSYLPLTAGQTCSTSGFSFVTVATLHTLSEPSFAHL